MVPIRILLTGGTIDKRYDPILEKTVFGETHIGRMLEQARNTAPVIIERLMMKDSLEMSDADRERILKRCQSARDTKILIVHGTSTLSNTAETLAKDTLMDHKTIVLTGAMVPFSLGNSDALFNLGCAMAAVQLLPSGVFIAMNGRTFKANDGYKDEEGGVFRAFNE